MHHPTDRIIYTTAFVTPVMEHWLEREIAQWVHSMKDQSDDPSHHERTLLPQSYISLPDIRFLLFIYYQNKCHVKLTFVLFGKKTCVSNDLSNSTSKFFIIESF